MVWPLIDRSNVPAAAVAATANVENPVVSVTVVLPLAVNPAMPAALMAAALAYADPAVWPAWEPATLVPTVTAVPVPTVMLRVPVSAAVVAVVDAVAICPI